MCLGLLRQNVWEGSRGCVNLAWDAGCWLGSSSRWQCCSLLQHGEGPNNNKKKSGDALSKVCTTDGDSKGLTAPDEVRLKVFIFCSNWFFKTLHWERVKKRTLNYISNLHYKNFWNTSWNALLMTKIWKSNVFFIWINVGNILLVTVWKCVNNGLPAVTDL